MSHESHDEPVARRYAVDVADLEASARVPLEDQVTEQDTTPVPLGDDVGRQSEQDVVLRYPG